MGSKVVTESEEARVWADHIKALFNAETRFAVLLHRTPRERAAIFKILKIRTPEEVFERLRAGTWCRQFE